VIKFYVISLFLLAPMTVWSQAKTVAPPAENAPMAEQQKWLVQAIGKYATYRGPTMSVKVSDPKIKGCSLSYTETKSFGAVSERVLIVTTRTDSVKNNVEIDLAKLDVPTMKLAEHISPDLIALTFRVRRAETGFKDFEIIFRQPAGEAIKTTLERVARGCAAVVADR
jgi:hypothetical protein